MGDDVVQLTNYQARSAHGLLGEHLALLLQLTGQAFQLVLCAATGAHHQAACPRSHCKA